MAESLQKLIRFDIGMIGSSVNSGLITHRLSTGRRGRWKNPSLLSTGGQPCRLTSLSVKNVTRSFPYFSASPITRKKNTNARRVKARRSNSWFRDFRPSLPKKADTPRLTNASLLSQTAPFRTSPAEAKAIGRGPPAAGRARPFLQSAQRRPFACMPPSLRRRRIVRIFSLSPDTAPSPPLTVRRSDRVSANRSMRMPADIWSLGPTAITSGPW